MRSRAMACSEMARGKLEGITRKHVPGPGAAEPRPKDRLDSVLSVHRLHRADQSMVRWRGVRIVSSGHVLFIVPKPALSLVLHLRIYPGDLRLYWPHTPTLLDRSH